MKEENCAEGEFTRFCAITAHRTIKLIELDFFLHRLVGLG